MEMSGESMKENPVKRRGGLALVFLFVAMMCSEGVAAPASCAKIGSTKTVVASRPKVSARTVRLAIVSPIELHMSIAAEGLRLVNGNPLRQRIKMSIW